MSASEDFRGRSSAWLPVTPCAFPRSRKSRAKPIARVSVRSAADRWRCTTLGRRPGEGGARLQHAGGGAPVAACSRPSPHAHRERVRAGARAYAREEAARVVTAESQRLKEQLQVETCISGKKRESASG